MAEYDTFWTNTKNQIKGWFGLNPSEIPVEVKALQAAANNALAFYDAHAPEQLKQKPSQPNDNLYINYAEMIVDKGVEFLFGNELGITIGSGDNTTGEDYLYLVWSDESRVEDLIDAATDGAIFGTVYLKIVIDQFGLPGVCVLDPLNMRVETERNNYQQINKFINQYQIGSGQDAYWHKEETSKEGNGWVIREFESKNGERWLQVGEDIVWKYSFAPVFCCKNLPKSKSFYGKPDLTKSVLELCKYLSRIDSLIGKIIRVHASPKPYAKGLNKQDLQIGTEDILFLGMGADTSLNLLEMTGDLAGAMAFRKELRSALSEISKIPEIATGKVESVGQLSGFALQILYGPLLAQTNLKRRLYGQLITELIEGLLEIGGLKNQTIELQWGSALPSNQKEDLEAGILQKNLGVSENTILRRLGFDPDHEQAMKETETAQVADALGKSFDAGAIN